MIERGSSFTFTRDLSYIASILFARVKITPQWKSTLRIAHSSVTYYNKGAYLGMLIQLPCALRLSRRFYRPVRT